MRAAPALCFIALLALVCSAGCGLKGPLYLPSAEEQRETAEREAALAERERRERAARPAVEASPAPTQTPAPTQDPTPAGPTVAPTN